MNVEHRIRDLERTNRFLMAIVAMLPILWLAGAVQSVPNELKARKVSIVDENGKVRISLEAKDAEAFLDFRTRKGVMLGSITQDDTGISLGMYQPNRESELEIGCYGEATQIGIKDNKGKSPRIHFAQQKDGSTTLQMWDSKGESVYSKTAR